MTLTDGQTKAVAYPAIGYNCNNEYQLAAKQSNGIGENVAGKEHCPDFDERFTLVDGKTKAIPYPQQGYNCSPEYAMNQKKWSESASITDKS